MYAGRRQKLTYSSDMDYKFYLLTQDDRILGITHESSDWIFYRDLTDGSRGKLPSDALDFLLEQRRWVWCATLEETRTNQGKGEDGAMFLVTHTGNVLEVLEKTMTSVKLKSLLTGRDAAISHQRLRVGIADDGWQIIDNVEAQVAALVNQEEFEGGWI